MVLLLPDCDNNEEFELPVTSLSEWLALRPVRLVGYYRSPHLAKAERTRNQSVGLRPVKSRLSTEYSRERIGHA